MLRRLLFVLLLLLYPLQWAAAQQHELSDDSGVIAMALAQHTPGAQALAHSDEAGGICQFHELAQPFAMVVAPPAGMPAPAAGRVWRAWTTAPPATGAGPDIERPQWQGRVPSFAANPAGAPG